MTSVDYQADNDAAMQDLGTKLAKVALAGTVIYLVGSLGAGKTTFVRGFLRGLGYIGKVKSPTYTLVEPYELDSIEVFHFDLYRLNQPNELLEIDMDDYFRPSSVCLIEWPDKGGEHLPAPDMTGYFDIIETIAEGDAASPTPRRVRFVAHSANGEEILARL
jgi:tRNA threonylcarbamoyladenosine biosynthesis protein TsaE